jgi:hypothetical protein
MYIIHPYFDGSEKKAGQSANETWAKWFQSYYSQSDNSTTARQALSKLTQYNGGFPDVTAFFNALNELNDQIISHGHLSGLTG